MSVTQDLWLRCLSSCKICQAVCDIITFADDVSTLILQGVRLFVPSLSFTSSVWGQPHASTTISKGNLYLQDPVNRELSLLSAAAWSEMKPRVRLFILPFKRCFKSLSLCVNTSRAGSSVYVPRGFSRPRLIVFFRQIGGNDFKPDGVLVKLKPIQAIQRSASYWRNRRWVHQRVCICASLKINRSPVVWCYAASQQSNDFWCRFADEDSHWKNVHQKKVSADEMFLTSCKTASDSSLSHIH